MPLNLIGLNNKSPKKPVKKSSVIKTKKQEDNTDKLIYKSVDFKRLTNFKAKLNPENRGYNPDLRLDVVYNVKRIKLSDIGDMKVWSLYIDKSIHPEVSNPYLAHNFIEIQE